MRRSRSVPPYRVDFVLIVLAGNLTRYITMRPLVDARSDVRARWYPVRTWYADDWLRFLPGFLRLRIRHLLDSRKLFARRPADAVVMHALDTYSAYGLMHRAMRMRTVLVNNPDGVDWAKASRLNRRALAIAVERTALFVPWSQFTAETMLRSFPAIRSRLVVLHPGLPLNDWPQRPSKTSGTPFRLLFVGGDAPRKGLDTLLDAFEGHLTETCVLDVASQAAYLTPELSARIDSLHGVRLHADLEPGSPELKRLFLEADAFVLPTRRDVSSWVAIEAMATGVPVIATMVGGIPDIVIDGRTGLAIPPDDPAAIAAAVERLRTSQDLAEQLVEAGRRHVEEHFDATSNTSRLLDLVERAVDRVRFGDNGAGEISSSPSHDPSRTTPTTPS